MGGLLHHQHLARALDLARHLALLLRRHAGVLAGEDLAGVRDVPRHQLRLGHRNLLGLEALLLLFGAHGNGKGVEMLRRPRSLSTGIFSVRRGPAARHGRGLLGYWFLVIACPRSGTREGFEDRRRAPRVPGYRFLITGRLSPAPIRAQQPITDNPEPITRASPGRLPPAPTNPPPTNNP